MQVICFENPGKIDPRLWTTFGVSAGKGEGAIGQFGTGLKYAIAVLMREGRALWIESGGEKYEFGTQDVEFRGQRFRQVTCNGEVLPFTTHLGHQWELWKAYRELTSNCFDEGGEVLRDRAPASPSSGRTYVFAELGDIQHEDVFLDTKGKTPLAVAGSCEVYPGESSVVFYRGVRAYDLGDRKARYTYNIHNATLTEDRTFAYGFELHGRIAEAVMKSDDKDFLTDFYTQTKGCFEELIDFGFTPNQPGERVLEVVRQYRKKDCYKQPGLKVKAEFAARERAVDGRGALKRITSAAGGCEEVDDGEY